MVDDIWPMRSPEASLGRLYAEYTGSSPDNIVPLSGSGSNRKYYRLSSGGYSIIGVSGRDARENRAFMALSGHMKARGINVPEVYASDPDGLSYLQEDLGSVSLFDAVSSGRYSGHYSPDEKNLLLKTISMLPDIQFKGADGLDFNVCYPEPAFNRRLVMADLNYFKYCFLKPSGIEFNEAELENDFDRLADALLREDGNTFMYRDFQARNVMLKDGIPYFIDFQGGRRGPVHYDVASFVWQARAGYPEDFRRELVDAYFEHMQGFSRTGREEFDERLRNVVDAYNSRDKLVFTSEVVADFVNDLSDQLLQILRDLQDDKTSFEKMGISFEEKAFYDILVKVRDDHGFPYADEKCLILAKKIKELVDDKSQFADWATRDDIKNQLNMDLTVLLYQNGYPPEWDEEVFEKVMEQAENFKKNIV